MTRNNVAIFNNLSAIKRTLFIPQVSGKHPLNRSPITGRISAKQLQLAHSFSSFFAASCILRHHSSGMSEAPSLPVASLFVGAI